MKKRFFLLGFLFLFVFMLTGCADHMVGGKLDISDLDIIGIDNEVVDTKRNIVEFDVDSSYTVFDLANIKVGKGIKVKAQDINGRDLGELLTLNDGENMFTLVFQFLNNTSAWTLIINKAPAIDSEVASIRVISGANSYVLNEDFKGLKIEISYANGKKEIKNVLKSEVEGFDTKSVGSKTLTITFGGKSCTYDILVTDAKAPVDIVYTVSDLKRSYTIGELFEGKIVKTINGVSEIIIITSEMLRGFNNQAPGNQHVTITYESFTYEVDVVIVGEALKDDEILELMATIDAVGSLSEEDKNDLIGNYNKYKSEAIEYFKAKPELTEPIITYVRLINVNKGQILEFKDLIETNVLGILKHVFKTDLNTGNQAAYEIFATLDRDTINLALNGISKATNIFTSNQLASLFIGYTSKVNEYDRNYKYYLRYDEAMQKLIEMTVDQVTGIVNNEGFTKYMSFKMLCANLPTTEEMVEYIDAIKVVLQKATSVISTDDVLSIVEVLNKDAITVAGEIDEVHRIAEILDEIVRTPELIKVGDFIYKSSTMKPSYGIDFYEDYSKYVRAIHFVISKLNVFTEYLKTVDLKTLEAVDGLIASNEQTGPNMKALVHLAGEALKLIKTLTSNPADKEEVVYVLSLFGDNADVMLDTLISKLEIFANCVIPDSGATEDQFRKFEDVINLCISFPRTIRRQIDFSKYESIFIKEGSSTDEFLRILNINYVLHEASGAIVELNGEHLSLSDLSKGLAVPGLHNIRITYNGKSDNIPYYVYENDLSDIKILNTDHIGNNSFIYFDKNLKPIKVSQMFEYDNRVTFENKMEFNDWLKTTRLYVYLPELNLRESISLEPYLNDINVEIVGDEGSGTSFGALKITSPLGEFYIVCNYTIVDDANLKVTRYSAGNGYSTYTILTQYENYDIIFVEYNYGFKSEEIHLDTPLNTNVLGEIDYIFKGTNLKFKVVTEFDKNTIVEVTKIDGLCNEKLNDIFKNDRYNIEVKYKSGRRSDVLPTTLLMQFAKTNNSRLEIKAIKRLEGGEYLYNLNVYANNEIVKTFEFKQRPISKEDYERLNYNIKDDNLGRIVSDSEYEAYLLKTEEEKLSEARSVINSLNVTVYGLSLKEDLEINNLLGYLADNKIPYHFIIDETNGYTKINLVVRDNVVLSYKVVSESRNKESVYYRFFASDQFGFYNPNNLTEAVLKEYLKTCRVKGEGILPYDLTQEEINDLVMNHIVSLSCINVRETILDVSFRYDSGNNDSVHIYRYSINLPFEVNVDDIVFTSTPTDEDIKNMYMNNMLRISYMYESFDKSIANMLSLKSFTNGVVTISINDGNLEKMLTFNASLDEGIDLAKATIYSRNELWYSGNMPTEMDIINSLDIYYQGKRVAGDLKPLLDKANYKITNIQLDGRNLTFDLDKNGSKKSFRVRAYSSDNLMYDSLRINLHLNTYDRDNEDYYILYKENGLDLTFNDIIKHIDSFILCGLGSYAHYGVTKSEGIEIINKLGYKILHVDDADGYSFYKITCDKLVEDVICKIAVTNKLEILSTYVYVDDSRTPILSEEMLLDRIYCVSILYTDGRHDIYYKNDSFMPYLGEITIEELSDRFVISFSKANSVEIRKPNLNI